MSESIVPDFFPKDWEYPREKKGDGFITKEYRDGTNVFIVLELGEIIDVETDFNDNSVHFEWDIDSLLPRFYTKEELEAEAELDT